jgi:hypothetical protein
MSKLSLFLNEKESIEFKEIPGNSCNNIAKEIKQWTIDNPDYVLPEEYEKMFSTAVKHFKINDKFLNDFKQLLNLNLE